MWLIRIVSGLFAGFQNELRPLSKCRQPAKKPATLKFEPSTGVKWVKWGSDSLKLPTVPQWLPGRLLLHPTCELKNLVRTLMSWIGILTCTLRLSPYHNSFYWRLFSWYDTTLKKKKSHSIEYNRLPSLTNFFSPKHSEQNAVLPSYPTKTSV